MVAHLLTNHSRVINHHLGATRFRVENAVILLELRVGPPLAVLVTIVSKQSPSGSLWDFIFDK